MLDLPAVSMDCSRCERHCCGAMPHCRTVLMPWESPKEFFGLVEKRGKLYLLKRRNNTRLCVFFDERTRHCSIYNKRPLECRLFPFVLKFSDHSVDLEVDKRCCNHVMFSELSTKRLLEGMAGLKFPAAWVWAYISYRE